VPYNETIGVVVFFCIFREEDNTDCPDTSKNILVLSSKHSERVPDGIFRKGGQKMIVIDCCTIFGRG